MTRAFVTILIFILVLVAAYYATYLIARFQRNRFKNGNMKIVEVLSLGNQERVHLVKVNHRYVLLGVTKTQITKLMEFSEDEIKDISREDSSKIVPFQYQLDKVLQRRSHVKDSNDETKNSEE